MWWGILCGFFVFFVLLSTWHTVPFIMYSPFRGSILFNSAPHPPLSVVQKISNTGLRLTTRKNGITCAQLTVYLMIERQLKRKERSTRLYRKRKNNIWIWGNCRPLLWFWWDSLLGVCVFEGADDNNRNSCSFVLVLMMWPAWIQLEMPYL